MNGRSSAPGRRTSSRALAALPAAALAVAVIAGSAAAGAATSQAARTRHGTEHIVIMGVSTTSSVDSVIATGAFTAGGSINLASAAGKVTLDGGALVLVPTFGPSRNRLNPDTCLMTITGRGTYTMGHGTGRYRGMSGSGRFTTSFRQVDARMANGKCSATRAVAFQGVITASGPVTLRG
jgi:hypothetical protein